MSRGGVALKIIRLPHPNALQLRIGELVRRRRPPLFRAEPAKGTFHRL
jgi:hypothetical protein